MSAQELEKISKYKITGKLGAGSMGVVYEGYDPDIQRKVAIKTLTPSISDESLIEEFHKRFKIEAQASARCMHPNIVTILEYGDLEGMPYIVMEYIKGQPLDEILKQNSPIKFNRAMRVMSQLLKGLHFAHESGVVHRDIKPSNIMLTDKDAVKITDFGIARLPASSEVTQVGYTVGTPHYMAPEQEASSNVDGRADLFSLTVIFMEVLAKIPVTSHVQHFSLSPKGIYITPRVNMNQEIPAPFMPVLQKGLAFKPENRFANAREYAAALKQAVDELQSSISDRAVVSPVQAQTTAAEKQQHIDDMENMLTHYIGPIAASLVDYYKDEYQTLSKLAVRLAEEIPDEQDRQRFVRAWEFDDEMMEAPRVDTGRVQTTIKAVDADATVVQAQTGLPGPEGVDIDRQTEARLREVYARYVGPMAEIILQESISGAVDREDLVSRLLDAIPTEAEKTDFRIEIRNIGGF